VVSFALHMGFARQSIIELLELVKVYVSSTIRHFERHPKMMRKRTLNSTTFMSLIKRLENLSINLYRCICELEVWLQVYRCIESIADLLQFTSFLEYGEEKSQETRITCMSPEQI
jgi:hypothetical protein